MGDASEHRYLVALGSNRRVQGLGAPRAVLAGAAAALAQSGWEVEAVARVIDSAPVGPSLRRLCQWRSDHRGRSRAAARAGEPAGDRTRFRARPARAALALAHARSRYRAVELGTWYGPRLAIPHPLFRQRYPVLRPAAQIAPDWRDPVSGLTLRQLAARAVRRR